jgi:hypothetical protein
LQLLESLEDRVNLDNLIAERGLTAAEERGNRVLLADILLKELVALANDSVKLLFREVGCIGQCAQRVL